MDNDIEKTEDKNLRDLTPEKDAKGGAPRKPGLSTSTPISGGPVPPIPAPDTDPASSVNPYGTK